MRIHIGTYGCPCESSRIGNFNMEILGALAERYIFAGRGLLPGTNQGGIEKARFWSLMAETVSLLTYFAGVSLRRMDRGR